MINIACIDFSLIIRVQNFYDPIAENILRTYKLDLGYCNPNSFHINPKDLKINRFFNQLSQD